MASNWNPKRPTVPVDAKGNWLHYPSWYEQNATALVEPFDAVLEVVQMNTGRSAKYVTLRNVETNITYPMFVSDLLDVVRYGEVSKGRMTGRWTVSKRGQNYGIKIVKE